MMYDRRDYGLMRLAEAYQWLPLTPLRTMSPLKRLRQEVEVISTLGLLTLELLTNYLNFRDERNFRLEKRHPSASH